jgi:hypothetical protein
MWVEEKEMGARERGKVGGVFNLNFSSYDLVMNLSLMIELV